MSVITVLVTAATPTPSPAPILVEVTGQAASGPPWWGVPVIAGIFLLAGACLGFVFNRSIERTRSAREDRTRWHDTVRELAGEIVALGDDLAWHGRVLDSLRDPNGTIPDDKVIAERDELKQFLPALKTMLSKANQLNLLVDEAIGEPMFLFFYVSRDMQKASKDDAERELAHRSHKRSKDAFIVAVRQYLEVPGETTKKSP
ncbi:hypothetical protein KK103_06830 [Curtobacterium flaccumfaciens pv. flaccumfaciens]|uniref:Uncharacterized protein n=1 Tax=Curtobacterium flaccumfaciens pv. flaccumfaciens TaxID=138532 RepID=A0A9Q2W4Q2_9MICO|nr:hypothetical protein [Curtobacterium flaccumfaciens]MBT1541471.1 hypothetical protein [Curtobacterium flaccumfaciens pv. flaccumfaciens]